MVTNSQPIRPLRKVVNINDKTLMPISSEYSLHRVVSKLDIGFINVAYPWSIFHNAGMIIPLRQKLLLQKNDDENILSYVLGGVKGRMLLLLFFVFFLGLESCSIVVAVNLTPTVIGAPLVGNGRLKNVKCNFVFVWHIGLHLFR